MKDLRIVIVSWNVETLLERNLKSLAAGCAGLDWDCVVVDNQSKDGSVALAEKISREIYDERGQSRIHVIANPDNRGFARACNQGIAGADARYVLLFNPDAEALPGSLTALVKVADSRPRSGILGPKLIYPDGRYQQSVRGFPAFWSQLLILLKLHHVFPWIPALRRYLADDLETEKEQVVDQVMGSCFLIRREVIEQIGGIDERYFIWFEEVDFCKMAHERGWEVVYVPSTTVIHHGGQSFGQVFSLRKQRYFDESMVKYFKKWMPGWRPRILAATHPIAVAQSWFLDIRNQPDKQWVYWMVAIVALETLSRATVFHPIARVIVTCALGVIVFCVAIVKPELGLSALLLELMIGSKGALTKIPAGDAIDGGVSLRIVLFASFMCGWIVYLVRSAHAEKGIVQRVRDLTRSITRSRTSWIVLAVLLAWGVVSGLIHRNVALISDANAWAFLVLLIPVIDIAVRRGERLIQLGTQVVIAALLWLPIKTLALLYVFSHALHNSSYTYLWLRRTGIGEATLVTGNLFRVFLQSQVYALAGIVFVAAKNLEQVKIRMTLMSAILIASFASLVMSLSRSFVIGVAAGAVMLLILFLLPETAPRIDQDHRVATFLSAFRHVGVAFALACAVIVAVVLFPIPHVTSGSLEDLLRSRGTTSDAAAQSRWALLPVLEKKIISSPILGSGFGATVTYVSKDPRILAAGGKGEYTTYAFEWGWLEHWIKLGILGIPVMLWLVLSMMWRMWRTRYPWWVRTGMISSLAALGVLHVFTPYLNHPLGFGFLLSTEALIEAEAAKRVTG